MILNAKEIISPKTRPFAVKKVLCLILLNLLIAISFCSVSYADWSFGIGTGIFGLNIDGDVGMDTIAGPVEIEVDLDAGDTMDLLESAFGLGGYATDGKCTIKYSIGTLELEGKESTYITAINNTVSAEVNYQADSAEVSVGYPVYRTPSVIVSLDGGVRYTAHEVSTNVTITGGPSANKKIDEKWTDVFIGTTVTVPFTKEWIWNTSANAAAGGSDGTYMGSTGVTWRFLENWSGTLFAKYTAVNYENSRKGHPTWYLYDVDEFGLGLSFLYHF
jgi:hypothetical protein